MKVNNSVKHYLKARQEAVTRDLGVKPNLAPLCEAKDEPEYIPYPRLTVATAVLQGLLAGGMDKSNSIQYLCRRALSYADTLLEEIEGGTDELEKH